MQRCNIRHVKEGAFRGLGRLVFLNLANNNIDILYQVAPAVGRVSPPRRVFISVPSVSPGVLRRSVLAEAAPGRPQPRGGDPARSVLPARLPQPAVAHPQPAGLHPQPGLPGEWTPRPRPRPPQPRQTGTFSSPQGLQNIKWLRLSHNSLNYLDLEAFAGLFTLTRLSLDHNELQFFPTETMTRQGCPPGSAAPT